MEHNPLGIEMPKEETLPTRKKMRKGTHSCFECRWTLSSLSRDSYLYFVLVLQLLYQSHSCIATLIRIFLFLFCPLSYQWTRLMQYRPPSQDQMYLPARQPGCVLGMLRTRQQMHRPGACQSRGHRRSPEEPSGEGVTLRSFG